MAKVIQIQTNEKLMHILMEGGDMYVKRLDTPDDVWKEVEAPILTGKSKNIKSKKDSEPVV